MRNYTQKLSKKERDQLELERESYQQIINEMTPITQEIQANIEDIIPCFNKNQPIIDIQKAEIESTNYATSFVDAQIGLYCPNFILHKTYVRRTQIKRFYSNRS